MSKYIAKRGERRLKRVAVVANASGTAGREYLTGIFRAVNERPLWTLDLFTTWGDFISAARKGDVPDGLLSVIPHTVETLDELVGLGIPSVVVDTPLQGVCFHGRMSFPHLDDRVIGDAAAEHLMSRGRFNSFVCLIDEPQYIYPSLREAAFRNRLESEGFSVKTVSISEDNRREWTSAEIQGVLSQLPRPIGVFAVRDRAALLVYDACRRLGFSIPKEVAVIGVDNDEIICETQVVTLSSIRPNHEGVGFNAAQELGRLLRGGKGRDLPDANSVREIVMRASTRIVPPTALLVANAQEFIQRRAGGRLPVNDIAAHLGVSRRLLDLRFRQICGESVLDAITRARIGFAKRRLSAKGKTISEIAAECGWSSCAAFTRFFQANAGATPREWRRSNASGTKSPSR